MDKQHFLISRLADGAFHSGETLAAELGISRTAVWKRIKSLAALELEIYSVTGKGHRLAQAIELLDATKVRAAMSTDTLAKLADLKIFPLIDSTNQFLSRLLGEDSIHAVVVLAEYQHRGRGRRGNKWVSPFASGLCLSLGWHFQSTPDAHTALSLAAGVAVCRSLQRLGIADVGLKWPNDIVSKGKKLGGILLESRSETAGCSDVVIGIGLNLQVSNRTLDTIQQAATDLVRVSPHAVSRNRLAGILIEELFGMLEDYRRRGFSSCIEDWRSFDALKGRQADIILPDNTLSGEILGIDDNGLLLMAVEGETKSFSSGEISLRARP